MTDISILISSLRDGGAERVTSDVFENLPPEVSCQLVTIYDEIKYPVKREPRYCLGFQHPNVGKNLRIIDIFSQLHFITKLCQHYRAVLRKNSVHVSMSVLELDNVVNILSCITSGRKHIISERNNPNRPMISGGDRICNLISYYLGGITASKIICNSFGVKEQLAKLYHIHPDKITVIYNPKDVDLIQKQMFEAIDIPFFNTEDPILITSGRLVDQKGHWHLLRVFAAIQEEIPCKLVICGIGPLEDYLKYLTEKLNIKDKVFFAGWCNNPHKYVHHSTIFVLPSLHEAQPNSLIEALICGCPVVSTDCNYGPREILGDNEFGLLSMPLCGDKLDAGVPLSPSEKDLKDKICLLLSDSKLYDKYHIKGLERGEMFRKEILIQKYSDTIREVLNK